VPFEIEKKLLVVTPALRITVKPTLGDHPSGKLKVVADWLLKTGDRSMKGHLQGQVLSLL